MMQSDTNVIFAPSQQHEAGDVRRFGPDGVLYEILRAGSNGQFAIRVHDTGEETWYSIAKALEDPPG